MKLVSVETPEKSVCKMTFSATAEELEAASNAVYERTRANYTICLLYTSRRAACSVRTACR